MRACTDVAVRHLFSRYADVGSTGLIDDPSTPYGDASLASANQRNRIRAASIQLDDPKWITVEATAVEVQRILAPGAGALQSLVSSQILTEGQMSTKLWLSVGWHSEGIGGRAVVDIGTGVRIALFADTVTTGIIGPPSMFSVTDDLRPASSDPGLYLDTLARVSALPDSNGEFSRPTLTITKRIPPGGPQETIGIPPFARFVTGLIDGTVTSTTLGTFYAAGAPGSAIAPQGALGHLEIPTTASQTTGRTAVPQSSASLRTTIASAVPVNLTLVFEIDL